ncbi:MAG: peptidase M17 [Kofleriaceae bacterium]|nr:peptidase M17 [Kofleriaceae bacterium]
MSLSILPLDLGRWDEAGQGTLVLTSFVDERPLRGAAGLADWRLCGRLSRLLRGDKVSGQRGETLMLPPGRRLPFTRLVWFGLGQSAGYGEDRLRTDLTWIAEVLDLAQLGPIALQPPGRATGLVGARRALELILAAWGGEGGRHLAVIEDPSGQKDVADLLRQHGAVR